MNVKKILSLFLPVCLLLCSCGGLGDTADTADGQLTYYYTEEYKDDMVEKIERYNRWCINHSTEDMKEQGYKEVENELLRPEENQTVQDEEFKNFFGDTYPGSEAFAAPVAFLR